MKIVSSAQEALHLVQPGHRVFLQGAAMTPNLLIDALCDRHEELSAIELISIHTEGHARYTEAPFAI